MSSPIPSATGRNRARLTRQRQQVDQHPGGCSPHCLVVEIEEVQRPVKWRDPPTFSMVRAWTRQFSDWCPHHPVSFARAWLKLDPLVQRCDNRHDVALRHDRREVLQLPDNLRSANVESNFFLGFTQRCFNRRLARITPPAREADLTTMTPHLHRTPCQ